MQASQDLFDLLVSKDFSVKTLDNKGKPVVDPSEAEMFSFDFETANKNYGTVVCLINDNQGLEMYYGDNVGKTMEKDDKDAWYDFLNQMKRFATRNLFQFDLKNMNRLRYSMQGMAAINEGLFEGWNGTKMTSYNDKRKNVRLKIVHDKPMEETDQRWRAVKTMFIETPEGERFKLPFKSTSAGKAMTRHVIEGGNPYDAFGNHIVDIVRETNALARFLRGKTRQVTEDHEDYELVQELKERYKTLRKRIKQVTGKRGYHAYKESWDPAQIEEGIVGKLAKRLGKAALKHGGKIAVPAAIGTMIAMNDPQDTDKKEPSPSTNLVKKDIKEGEDETFNDGDQVVLVPPYAEDESEVFTLTQWDEMRGRGFIADEDGRGWYVDAKQITHAPEDDEDEDLDEAHGNSKVYDKCWKGYKKVPGKKRGEKGSCVKEDERTFADYNKDALKRWMKHHAVSRDDLENVDLGTENAKGDQIIYTDGEELDEAKDPKILAMKLHRMLKKYDAEADTHYDMYGQPDYLATIKLAMAGKIEDAAGEFVSNYTDQDGGEAAGADDMYEELKYEIKQIMGNNVQANEGFRNELEGGKVPVGNYTFVYTMDNPADLDFVVRSAEERGMAVLAKGKTKARIDGNAGQHTSLVRSLQDLSIRTRDYNGSVTEPHRAGELQMESVPLGSYMIWTVTFADGTTKQYKGNDEAKRSLEKKHPEAVKITTDWVVRSDDELYDHAQANTMKELNEFENWADEVTEGTWAIPDTKDKVEELADLMSRPMIVGIDGADAQDALYDIIGDDELMDDLYALSQEEGADADARPVVMNWIGAHEANFPGLREKLQGSTQESVEEAKAKPDYIDLDGDGNKKESMKKAAKDKKKKMKEEHDLDTSEEVKKPVRDPMLEAADWARLAGLSQKVYAEAEGDLEEDILPFGWGDTSPAEMMSKLRKNFPNDPRWGNEEGEAPPVSGTISRELPSDGGPDGGGLGDRYSPPTKDGVSPPTRRVGEESMQQRLERSVTEEWEDEGLDDRSAAQQLDKMLADGKSLLAAAQELASYYGVEPYEVVQAGEYYGSMETKKLLAGFRKLLGTDSVEEGNQFTGALAKAKAAGAEEFEVDGKKYKVNEVDAGKYGQADFDEKETQAVTPGANTMSEKEIEEGMADVMGDEEIKDPFPELPQVAHDGDADSYADKYSDDGSRVGTQGKDTADDDISWIKRALGNK
jgi:hypothetical protein